MMHQPRSGYVTVGEHELHVTHWGDASNPPLIMWHGLARTGRDFDELAAHMANDHFVLCPDTLGRGLSAWSRAPVDDYTYGRYAHHAIAIMDHYGIRQTKWVGTSMGGLLGLVLASGPAGGRISHLVVNDVGPVIPAAALQRIGQYVAEQPVFETIGDLEAWLRRTYAPFGPNDDLFWRRMADTSARRLPDGRITLHYDPEIATPFVDPRADVDLWAHWDAVDATTLLLRGATSDVLTSEVAEEMTSRGPEPELRIYEECGHAPSLTSANQKADVRRFLTS